MQELHLSRAHTLSDGGLDMVHLLHTRLISHLIFIGVTSLYLVHSGAFCAMPKCVVHRCRLHDEAWCNLCRAELLMPDTSPFEVQGGLWSGGASR